MDTTTADTMDIEHGFHDIENTMDCAVERMDSAINPEPASAPASTALVPANTTIRVLNMGGTRSEKMNRMKTQGRSILTLCRNSRDRITPDRAEEMKNRFADASLYLDWLNTDLEMTPQINAVTKVELVLQKLIEPTNNVPDELVNKARTLLEKYRADNWGQDVVGDEEPDETPPAEPLREEISIIQLPSPTDPIFGVEGIMYGVITVTSGKRKDYRLRTDIPRRSAKVYGHNGIALGTWFPLQISAIFWGAHGARMAGIAGSVKTGAWSIVVAGTYEDLDTDNGDTLYYSGSNSHENTNPQRAAPASQGTTALHASYTTRNPVRVLRSGGSFNTRNQNRHLPSCGLRYDGLYSVVAFRQRKNRKGGLYDQFKLERLPGQTPLAELERTSPTTEQIFAHDLLRGRH